MADTSRGQPAVNEPPHPVPGDRAVLAPAPQRPVPEAADLEAEDEQRVAVRGHTVIADVPADHGAQPCAHYRNGVMHASSEFDFHRAQLRLQSLANRLPPHRETSIALLRPADVRE